MEILLHKLRCIKSALIWMLLLPIWTANSLCAQNFNRPVPGDFHPYEFEKLRNGYEGFYFTSPYYWGSMNSMYYIAMLGPEGYVAWWAKSSFPLLDFKYLPEKNHFSYFRIVGASQIEYYTLGTAFESLDTLSVAFPGADSHEFQILQNGNRLVIAMMDTIMDLRGYVFEGNPGVENTTVRDMCIREYDANGQPVFSWRAAAHIHPSEFIDGYGYLPSNFNFAHANSVDEDTDGHLIISFRHLEAVYKVHRTTGQVIWRLGGKSSDFTFPNDPNGFSGQHSVRRLSNGRIGMFDNGNFRPGPSYSRAVEYALDTVTGEATMLFAYDAGQNYYADATGSYQHDDPDWRCIAWGNAAAPAPDMTLLDQDGQVHARISFGNNIVSYRAYAFELPIAFPRPAITCEHLGGSLRLHAPAGYSSYLWSTGETTASIVVTDPGDYMVWVPYGVGMLGAKPFHFLSLGQGCQPVGAAEAVLGHYNARPDQLLAVYDLAGRRLPKPVQGQICVMRYRSGMARLVLWKE